MLMSNKYAAPDGAGFLSSCLNYKYFAPTALKSPLAFYCYSTENSEEPKNALAGSQRAAQNGAIAYLP
jgi:hypothetical protein